MHGEIVRRICKLLRHVWLNLRSNTNVNTLDGTPDNHLELFEISYLPHHAGEVRVLASARITSTEGFNEPAESFRVPLTRFLGSRAAGQDQESENRRRAHLTGMNDEFRARVLSGVQVCCWLFYKQQHTG